MVSGKEVPGRAKAGVSVVLAFVTTPIVYGLLLVDGGLIHYDYRGLLAAFGLSFMTAWAVFQRSKFKDKSGEVIQDSGEATQKVGITAGVGDPPFFDDQYDY